MGTSRNPPRRPLRRLRWDRLLNALALWRSPRHRRNIGAAHRLLKRFRGRAWAWASCLAYLRKIDPFVFEELILLAALGEGARIRRNARYTGDGGVDGRFTLGKQTWIVQAKRYSRPIDAAHVRELQAVLGPGQCGLFVHTGRTGKAATQVSHVRIVSGQALTSWLTGQAPPWCLSGSMKKPRSKPPC